MNAFPELSGFGALTPWGLLLLFIAITFFMLARGQLYTGRQHKEVVGAQEKVAALYKAAEEKQGEANSELLTQNTILIRELSLFTHFISEADRVRLSAQAQAATPNTGVMSTTEGGSHVG